MLQIAIFAIVACSRLAKARDPVVPFVQLTNLDNLASHPCYNLLLWKRCLYATCDFRPHHKGDDMKQWTPEPFMKALSDFTATDRPFRAFIQTTQYRQFVNASLPLLQARRIPYILVVGASDLSQSEVWAEHQLVLADPNCISIFAHNADVSHPRIRPLPLGMPYNDNRVLAHGTPLSLNEMVFNLSRQHQPSDKDMRVVVNFRVVTNRGTRSHARDDLATHLSQTHWIDLPNKTPVTVIWNATATASFVLAPMGHGLDAHRNWEALALGAIPLMLEMGPTMHTLYKDVGFPVVIVDSYKEVTFENLVKWHHELLPSILALRENPERLLARYYMKQIFTAHEA
eukprot:TRINITY_DN12599_c1_g17_i1.p2 TRINITY_DN12599_c1_g17~~TRINITY_DN12599_c1_g17_i1.p2  ORF type:complete len:343 (+),score=52.17 TRINITY_DN12599_c1_g17_i1:2970-3998(+)